MRAPSFAPARWVLLAAAIAPAVLAWRVQRKNWINIPIWDEWDCPGNALLRHAQHLLTWTDLFLQHNESRKVVPRLIHIGIATFAGWDVRQGMVLTLLCACAASAFALANLRRRAGLAFSQVFVPWLLINLLLFAPSQYENFLSGFTFEIFIPFLCLFACSAVNLSRAALPTKVACNALLALISSYTFAHGLLLWAFAIPTSNREERSRKPRFFVLCYAVYIAIAILSIAGYFVGYRRPEISPPTPTLGESGHILEFMCVWLGAGWRSPLVNAHFSGAIVGLLIIMAVAGTFFVLRNEKESWRTYYPWLLLLAFALSSGAVTAVGRVTIGVANVFNTAFTGFSGMRYNVTSVFASVAVVGLLFNLYHDRIRPEPVWRRRFLISLSALCVLVAAAWIAMLSDEWIRVRQFQANRKRARTAVIWSNALPQNPEIFLAYPYPDFFWRRVEEMRAAGLIQLPRVSDALGKAIATLPAAPNQESGHLDPSEPLPPAYARFSGWVRNPVKQTAADYAVLGWQNADNSFQPFTAIPTAIVRPDVARAYGSSSLKAGFDQDIETSRLPPAARTIKAWAIDWEAQQAFAVDGTNVLDRSH